MIAEVDIWRSTHLLVEQHGQDTAEQPEPSHP